MGLQVWICSQHRQSECYGTFAKLYTSWHQAVEEYKKKKNILLPLFWSIKSIIQMIKPPFSLSVFAAMLLQLPPNWCCQWPSFFNMNEISVKWKELPRRACMPSAGFWHIQSWFFLLLKKNNNKINATIIWFFLWKDDDLKMGWCRDYDPQITTRTTTKKLICCVVSCLRLLSRPHKIPFASWSDCKIFLVVGGLENP